MSLLKKLTQIILGIALTYAGSLHLTSSRQEFQAQVPTWLPVEPDVVVVASGLVEITLGVLLITTAFIFKKYRSVVGFIAGVFFILIFPGNINQYVNQIDAFGLDTDTKRLIRLFFQPPLVAWAIWSTNAWQIVRKILKAS